jgi:hypothetical protein
LAGASWFFLRAEKVEGARLSAEQEEQREKWHNGPVGKLHEGEEN